MNKSLKDIDEACINFPRPVQAVMLIFRSECLFAINKIIDRLDLVPKRDYLVQKQLLLKAYDKISELESRVEGLDEERDI